MRLTTTPFITLCSGLLIAGSTLFAQPVLVNTMSPIPVGTTDSIYKTTATVPPGSGGAGVTWDLSGLNPGLALGVAYIVTPSSTPYFTTFPTTTLCAKITPTGSTSSIYSYDRLSSTKWEQLANNYTGPGSGDDYTPNPESNLEFPMSYLNSFVDTFQKTGGSANTVTITYDGYGTLKTPFATYTNVVRIYKYWGPGDYDYNWLVTTPYLGDIASFDAQSNTYTLTGPVGGTTGVNAVSATGTVYLYPNPFTETATLIAEPPGGLVNASLVITDITGRIAKTLPLSANATTIQRDGLNPGIYLYAVFNDGIRISNGRFVIQ